MCLHNILALSNFKLIKVKHLCTEQFKKYLDMKVIRTDR